MRARAVRFIRSALVILRARYNPKIIPSAGSCCHHDCSASRCRHGESDLALLPALANRHGLITGATGTGKTITLQVLAERFSAIGVPVFMADVKGDLSGIAAAGVESPNLPSA